MALEDLIGKEIVGKIKGKPFGIDPSLKYYIGKDEDREKSVRETFVKATGALFDVEEYSNALRKDSGDISALNDLAGVAVRYMAGNPEDNMTMMRDPHTALEQADCLLGTGYVNMAKFVENNRDEIFERLSAEQLYSLFTQVQLYRTGDKEHDRIRELTKKVKGMQEASQNGSDPSSVIKKDIEEFLNSIPEEQKMFYQRNSKVARPSYIHSIIGGIQRAFGGLFQLPDKKGFDKDALVKYLEDNFKVVEDLIGESERTDGEKADLWDKNIKPAYVTIARILYGPEKKILKRDKDEDKEDRKAAAAKVGARA